ncbi:MAG: glycosyltransferase family 39 protein [Patescibacteria group bacterium]|nr:glycosyltransferase family 39 protein [Patescibacteria group bacterium]
MAKSPAIQRNRWWVLGGILVLALVIRWWGIGTTDMLGDEAADAFRSIGYVDYLGSSFQTQPIDWYNHQPLPGWASLSFHDDPPLFFMIQHAFFAMLGDSALVARLPAIFAGTLATLLLYLITRKVLEDRERRKEAAYVPSEVIEWVASTAAALFAIEPATVGIFRTSLIEPILIFFILLNLFFFLKMLENRKYWVLFGLSLGAVALTKYTGAFLLPAYVLYLAIAHRSMFKDWRLYASLLLALIVFSPVIIYNMEMYKARGHFDLQLAYLLHQSTPEWTGLVGKDQSPFSDIVKNLASNYGIPLLAVVAGGLAAAWQWRKKYAARGLWLIAAYLAFLVTLFIGIGSANRFLAMLSPALMVLAALALVELWRAMPGTRWNMLFRTVVVLFLAWELGLSAWRNIIAFPSYGVAGLDAYLTQEMGGIQSSAVPQADNSHLNDIINAFAAHRSDKPEARVVIVYNDNVTLPTLEWIFYRRFFYHAIPALFVQNFEKVLQTQGAGYFSGFTIYFVQSTDHTLLSPTKLTETAGDEFEQWVMSKGINPAKTILASDGQPAFRVYKFSL